MKQAARQAKAREAEAIMLAGGFTEARAEHFGPWWRVRGSLAEGDEHSGVTHVQADPQDPCAMARTLVAKLTAAKSDASDGYETAEAIATEKPLFTPADDPFSPLDADHEEVENLEHEGDGETGEEEDAGDAPGDAELSGVGTDVSGPVHRASADLDADDILLDADFTEDTDLPGLPQDLGAEILDADASESATPQDRFYGLDDLDRRRSLRIGDVVRISRARQADIAALMGDHDFASLQGQVLRDTIDGTYRGPQGVYDTFVELSRHQNGITRILMVERDKIAFVEAASREELEGFDPEAGWP